MESRFFWGLVRLKLQNVFVSRRVAPPPRHNKKSLPLGIMIVSIFRPRNTNSFRVSVNIAASSKVTFSLIYQELLQRKLGSYEHVIHVDPGQVVRDLQIEVNIDESRPITFLRVPHLRHELLNSIESQSKHGFDDNL